MEGMESKKEAALIDKRRDKLLLAIYIGIVIGSICAARYSYLANLPCAEKYKLAWQDCNNDYNGKCAYLGPKYEPNCTIERSYFSDPYEGFGPKPEGLIFTFSKELNKP